MEDKNMHVTKETLLNCQITQAKMQKDIEHISDNVDDIKKYIEKDIQWKENFAVTLDKKYAGKWIEVISISAFGGIMVGVVLLLINKI